MSQPPRPMPAVTIARKRDGLRLRDEDIASLVRGCVDESWADSQIGAMTMAIVLKGLDRDECVRLTHAMTHSGQVLDWSKDLPGPTLDKHSTGGVGDKVSLVLAPMVAACGGFVPMVSGRGLGHTGGTLDKLDSIPGYDTAPSIATFRSTVASSGCAIIGQTTDLAPADDRMYAIRDVTATVESIPLITASILSKKLSEGLRGLVMDVKVGTGAFSPHIAEARELAASIVEVACGAGLPTTALVTDMDSVLGRTAGNAVEVRETVEFLTTKRREGRFLEVTLALGAEMLVLGRLAPTLEAARAALAKALDDGRAAERFARMVRALGGPSDFLENPDRHLPRAPVVLPVAPREAGFVRAVDAKALGMAVVGMGGGRRKPGDTIDYSVGLTEVATLGEEVGPQRPLAVVHARTQEGAEEARAAVLASVEVGREALPVRGVVRERVAGKAP